MSRLHPARRWTACAPAVPARARSGPDEGFSLIEVLAAVFIFAVISTAAFTLIVSALKTVHQNNERVLTANVARSQVEYLRTLGTTGITPGQSTAKPPGAPADFTVLTSAQWVGLGQTASACDAASPGQAYLRIHVEVSSPDVEGPSILDTVIAPSTAVSTTGTGAIAVSVDDQNGEDVAGVTVQAVDSAHPANSFTYVTGADGCLFVPQLIAPSTLQITINKAGYVPSTPAGTQATVPIDADNLSKPTFHYAPAAAISFAGALTDFPVPNGMPLHWILNETGATDHVGAIGTAVTGQWPTVSGFTSWIGDCPDADPEGYASTRQQFGFVPGGVVTAALTVRPVKIRGLPADTAVKVKHAGSGTGCTNAEFAIGKTNDKGIIRVGLPNGTWQVISSGETQEVGPLAPPAAGQEEEAAVVNFTLADLDNPNPSASPSGSASPAPSGSPAP